MASLDVTRDVSTAGGGAAGDRTAPAGTSLGRLWVRWMISSAGGELLGLAVIAAAAAGLEASAQRLEGAVPALMVVAVALAGALLGAAQWSVLAPLLPSVDRGAWMVATAAATAVAWTLGAAGHAAAADGAPLVPGCISAAALLGGALPAGIVVGALLGFAQWPLLRLHFASAWAWIPANAVGWALGSGLAFAWVGRCQPAEPSASVAVLGLSAAVLAGLVAAGTTGGALVMLVRARSR